MCNNSFPGVYVCVLWLTCGRCVGIPHENKTMNATDNHGKRTDNIFIALYCSCQLVCMANSTLHDETKIRNYFPVLNVPGLEDSMQKNESGLKDLLYLVIW